MTKYFNIIDLPEEYFGKEYFGFDFEVYGPYMEPLELRLKPIGSAGETIVIGDLFELDIHIDRFVEFLKSITIFSGSGKDFDIQYAYSEFGVNMKMRSFEKITIFSEKE